MEPSPSAADELAAITIAVRPPEPAIARTIPGLGAQAESIAPAIAGGALLGPDVVVVEARPLIATRAQVEKKFDAHAATFGVTGPRGKAGFEQLEDQLHAFAEDPRKVHIMGTYRGDLVLISVDPEEHPVLLQEPDGTFVSGWRLTVGQEWNIINRGSL